MQRLRSRSRPLLFFMASSPHRCWWPSALKGRVFPPRESTNPRPPRRFPDGSRNMASSSGVKRDNIITLDMRLLGSSANENPAAAQGMGKVERLCATKEFKAHGEEDMEKTTMDVTYADENACTAALATAGNASGKTVDVPDGAEEIVIDDGEYFDNWYAKMAHYPSDSVSPLLILPRSSHRDGSIYKHTSDSSWKEYYRIENRNETSLEAMMFTEPQNCFFLNDLCLHHKPRRMFQIFSLKLAENRVGGLVQLYGYIAVRDMVDPLLNYVVHFTRDDPIIVKKGSLINMIGPKRGIDFLGDIIIEYDMRIKTGEQENHDLPLIDGASVFCDRSTSNCRVITKRIHGEFGAVDMAIARIEHGIEATIEVLISEVQRGFSLCLGCFTSGFKEKIRLFYGVIGESRCLKRSVVAVVDSSWVELKFKLGLASSCSAERRCSFRPADHGHSGQEIETDFALFSVKVTWSALARKV